MKYRDARMRTIIMGLTVVLLIALGMFALPGTAFAEGTISVSPSSGVSGSQVTVQGSGFTSSDYPSGLPIQVNVDHGNGNWDLIETVATAQPDPNGDINVQIRIPSSAPSGLLAISAFTGSGASPSASFTSTGGGGTSSQNQYQQPGGSNSRAGRSEL